ncbi:MAG: type II secretion system protein [Candidatus Omnitrophota bacterium]
MKRFPDCQKGFTFLEILAALVILSVALVPIMTWMPVNIQTRLAAEQRTTAIFLAQGLMEQLRYQIINNFTTPRNVTSQNFASPYQNYAYSVTDNQDANLKTISASVWHSEKPNAKTVFYTQVARR